jgi:hypothetical protein
LVATGETGAAVHNTLACIVEHNATDHTSSCSVAGCDWPDASGCAKLSAAARLATVSQGATLPQTSGLRGVACGMKGRRGSAVSACLLSTKDGSPVNKPVIVRIPRVCFPGNQNRFRFFSFQNRTTYRHRSCTSCGQRRSGRWRVRTRVKGTLWQARVLFAALTTFPWLMSASWAVALPRSFWKGTYCPELPFYRAGKSRRRRNRKHKK